MTGTYLNWLQNRILYQLYTPPGGSDSLQEPELSWHCKWPSSCCARYFALHVLLYSLFHMCDTVIGRLGWTGVNIYCRVCMYSLYVCSLECSLGFYVYVWECVCMCMCVCLPACVHVCVRVWCYWIVKRGKGGRKGKEKRCTKSRGRRKGEKERGKRGRAKKEEKRRRKGKQMQKKEGGGGKQPRYIFEFC